MATQKETVEHILSSLGDSERFTTRFMFGEYALYAEAKVVALICNDQLYVKILPASIELEKICDQDSPYPGAKAHYVIEESQLTQIKNLPDILMAIADALPKPKKKVKKKII